jgi:ABC-type sugar transport system substrate-binding protein
LIYTTNATWGLYFASYFKKHNINKKLITFDSLPEINDLINEGIIDIAISQRPNIWGEIVVKWISDSLKGREVPKYYDTGTFEISKSNLSVFDKRFSRK